MAHAGQAARHWARAGTLRIDTIRRAIKELVSAGFIMSEKGQRSNRYQLCVATSAGAESASAEISCRRGKCADRKANPADAETAPTGGLQNPAGALCVLFAGAETASALYTMNESKNESREDAAARPDSPLSRSPSMEAKNEPERTPSPKPKSTPKPKVTWDGERFNIPDVQMALWEAAYPTIDVANEIAKAAAWLVSNGEKKKAFGRFLNGWLGRAKPTRTETAYVASASAEADWLEIIEQNRRSAANA